MAGNPVDSVAVEEAAETAVASLSYLRGERPTAHLISCLLGYNQLKVCSIVESLDFVEVAVLTKVSVATSVAFLFVVWMVGASQTTDRSKAKIRPDLTGVWALDDAKSNINAGVKEKISDYVLTIDHHEPEIRISRTYKQGGRERSEQTIYYTDGRAEFNSVKGKDSEPVTRWDGKKLVRRSSTVPNGAPQTFPSIEIVTTETWELSSDGKTLTRTIRSSGVVSLNLRQVFTRLS